MYILLYFVDSRKVLYDVCWYLGCDGGLNLVENWYVVYGMRLNVCNVLEKCSFLVMWLVGIEFGFCWVVVWCCWFNLYVWW